MPIIRRESNDGYIFCKSAEKTMWAELGFGDFYHQLSMNILDICAKNRHRNGGIMKIDEIIAAYWKK